MPEETISEIASKCRVLVLDIEGTTTSISFVKDKLFPYAAEHVRGFLEAAWGDEEVRAAVAALRQLALDDAGEAREGVVAVPAEDASKEEQIAGLVGSVRWLMEQDRKAGPLKQLQGLIWQQGYASGDLEGHVYPDVSPALTSWRALGGRVFIYSSGSERAQRLLFGHSAAGDLLPLIDGHFDTAVGGKREPDSYKKIAEKIDAAPAEILFLTDIVEEAEAARAAGLQAALVSREGNAQLPPSPALPVLTSLADLAPPAAPAPAKRKQDSQDEQPTKVAKAFLGDDIKSAVEAEKLESVKPVSEKPAPEVMEVDPTSASDAEVTRTLVKEDILIEELPVTAEVEAESPVPEVVEESPVESVDTDTEEVKDIVDDGKGDDDADVAEVETVIEEVKPEESTDVAEENEPLVEEPLEALDEECDRLLARVRDVADLARPLLATVPEEATNTPTHADHADNKGSNGTEETRHNGGNKEANGVNLNGSSEGAERLGSAAAEKNGADGETLNGNKATECGTDTEIKVKAVPNEITSEVIEHPTDA